MPLMIREFVAELHVHTVLSPCAGVEMIPPLIVEEALQRGIHIIAITDHNATANVIAVQKAAKHTGLTVLPGMEVQTKEEVHMLCLFETLEQLDAWQTIVSNHLPTLENNPEYFGDQYIVDDTGDLIRTESQLLLTSTELTLNQAYQNVTELGGLAIPAHVDRQSFGLFANLGFIPPEIPFEALEISARNSYSDVCKKYPTIKGYPVIQSGDVHYLNDFLGANHFQILEPTLEEIKRALRAEEGRYFSILRKDPILQGG